MCYRLNDWGVAWRTVETRVGKFYRLAKAIPMVFRGATAIIATAIMNALFVDYCPLLTVGYSLAIQLCKEYTQQTPH